MSGGGVEGGDNVVLGGDRERGSWILLGMSFVGGNMYQEEYDWMHVGSC